MDQLRLKTLWSLISFFSIWGSGGREQFAGRGVCVRACMCMTHLLWLVLCPSHPHTHASPFSVSSCKLLPGVTHGKSVFFFFHDDPSHCPACHTHFRFLTRRVDLGGSDTHVRLALIASLTGSRLIFHIMVSWQCISQSEPCFPSAAV